MILLLNLVLLEGKGIGFPAALGLSRGVDPMREQTDAFLEIVL